MTRQRRFAAAALLAALALGRLAAADAYDPPVGYYSTATGTSAALKQQLNLIIDSTDDPGIDDELHTPKSYDELRTILQVTDADPNNPGHMLLVYDRVSLNVAAINPGGPIPGWDNGFSWNREHTWPVSRGLGSESMPDGSDLHHLRPSTPGVNSDRGNSNFGGAYGAQPFGYVMDNASNLWYPGDADAGMIARSEFYMAVRYDGADAGTTNLELAAGNPSETGSLLGNLNRLVEWHFAAPPESFERRRHQIVYENYQHNRNPFIDRPEFVWSVFVDQANDSQISIGGATVGGDGGSTRNVDLGRVLIGSAVPAAQTFTLNKSGSDGTYYEVTTGGAATSSLAGRFNAFRTNQIDSKSISVGLNSDTATAGSRSGTVTIDNLDVTTVGGTGQGAYDANDVFNVSLAVLDHATPTFESASLATSLTHDFGSVLVGSSAPTFEFDVFNLMATPGYTAEMDFDSVMATGDLAAFTTDMSSAAGTLSLAAGTGHTFAAMLNTPAVGDFSATYTLMFSDEDLPGAVNKSLMLTLVGEVRLAGDYNGDGKVDAADYIVWRATYGQDELPFSGADGDGSGMIDNGDYAVWTTNFGETSPGSGSFSSSSVPESANAALAVIIVTGFACAWRLNPRRSRGLPARE